MAVSFVGLIAWSNKHFILRTRNARPSRRAPDILDLVVRMTRFYFAQYGARGTSDVVLALSIPNPGSKLASISKMRK